MHTDYVHEVNRICESLAHLKITSDWNQESDVYVVCVDVSLLNEDTFQKKLYNAQIVWVGYGLKEYGYMLKRKLPYEHFDCVFLKIKMKGLVFVNEVGIYLSLDLRMVYVSQLYVVKMFLNEFLGYEIQYVFNVTGNYFLDLNKTFQENQIAYGDILIYGR